MQLTFIGSCAYLAHPPVFLQKVARKNFNPKIGRGKEKLANLLILSGFWSQLVKAKALVNLYSICTSKNKNRSMLCLNMLFQLKLPSVSGSSSLNLDLNDFGMGYGWETCTVWVKKSLNQDSWDLRINRIFFSFFQPLLFYIF